MAIKQSDDEIVAVSERFYDALEGMANGDASAMPAVWSHADDVTTMHPIGGREVGWDEVKEPWNAVASMAVEGKGTITPIDRLVRVSGDIAYEVLTEKVSMSLAHHPLEGDYRATNVYRREDGEWKMVHHHSDLSQEFVDTLQKIESGS